MSTILKVCELNHSLEFSTDGGFMTIKAFEEDEINTITKISEIQLEQADVLELIEFLKKCVREIG